MSSENFAKLYKNAGKPDDLRRRRTESSVELRKKKGNDEMMKRRNLQVDLGDESATSGGGSDSELNDSQQTATTQSVQQQQSPSLEEAVAILQENPSAEQVRRAFESVRRALSCNKDPPIDKVIQLGFPCALVQALSFDDDKVKFEAAWSMTNIVSGTSEQTMTMVKAGAVGPLIKLCASQSLKLAEQAVWCVANIAGESAQLRDLLLAEGLLPVLLDKTRRLAELNTPFVRILTWTLSNLCRHKKPQVALDLLATIAPALFKLLKYKDIQTQSDACWAFSYLTDGTDENIGLAIGYVQDMVKFLGSGQDSLITPALRVLGNFVTGNDEQTQVVIDSGILSGAVLQLLLLNNPTFVKECCWLVSNVMAGSTTQIQDVIDAQLLPMLLEILQNGEHKVQFEAGWAIANLCYGGTPNQITEICRAKNGVEAICACLVVKNNELIMNMLGALRTVLRTVAQTDPENLQKLCDRVEGCNGLDYVEALQQHESEKIYTITFQIIEEFFSEEEEEKLGEAQPQQQNGGGMFEF